MKREWSVNLNNFKLLNIYKLVCATQPKYEEQIITGTHHLYGIKKNVLTGKICFENCFRQNSVKFVVNWMIYKST